MRTKEDEILKLDTALNLFFNDCRSRLHEMAKRGKRGWDDPEQTEDILLDLLEDALNAVHECDRLHLHDIANRAMMAWFVTYHQNLGCPKTVLEKTRDELP